MHWKHLESAVSIVALFQGSHMPLPLVFLPTAGGQFGQHRLEHFWIQDGELILEAARFTVLGEDVLKMVREEGVVRSWRVCTRASFSIRDLHEA